MRANHLQRRPGSRPSGKRRNKNTLKPTGRIQNQDIIHAAAWPTARERGAASSAWIEYSALRWATPIKRPIMHSSQPKGFRGERWEATNAPTGEKPSATRVLGTQNW